jgi:hypothetical protein
MSKLRLFRLTLQGLLIALLAGAFYPAMSWQFWAITLLAHIYVGVLEDDWKGQSK